MGIEKELLYTYLTPMDPAEVDLNKSATVLIAVDDQSVTSESVTDQGYQNPFLTCGQRQPPTIGTGATLFS